MALSRLLQANINHCARAQDLLLQSMAQWSWIVCLDVAAVADPYFVPPRDDWVCDDNRSSNFKEDEISRGKVLLFQTLGKIHKMPSRRRDGTQKSIQDIIDLLKMTDPDDVPAFVAKELHKLPPVTFDHVDVTRLLKDITYLKTTLAEVESKLEASDKTISELRAEVVQLRSATSECRSHDASNVNMRRGAKNALGGSFVFATVDSADDASRHSAASSTPPIEALSQRNSPIPKSAYAAVAAKPAASQSKTQKEGKQIQIVQTHEDLRQPGLKTNRVDADGFVKVEKKKEKPSSRNQCGSAQPSDAGTSLRTAVPTTQLYLSRLHYSTKAEEIVEYIRMKTTWILRVVKLESRYNVNFNSFVVRVPTQHLATFMQQSFWPTGVVFRRFRGRIPCTTRNST
ncbi:uncharacterized protein LOC124542592 [Vanessa cardui]|uniref:uncharacterized protein LOC124542592 n=1 Tax=Vanessa cardui TaxID=171605 RepID=UPI001F145C5A|nr:uncharacterized protein LOC124542592 [Vanessa cardui]